MGAYALSAYAGVLNLQRNLLFSPISTLNRNLQDFDEKWLMESGDELWAGSYSDEAQLNITSYIFYDPLTKVDNDHVYRYKNSKVIKIKVSGGSYE